MNRLPMLVVRHNLFVHLFMVCNLTCVGSCITAAAPVKCLHAATGMFTIHLFYNIVFSLLMHLLSEFILFLHLWTWQGDQEEGQGCTKWWWGDGCHSGDVILPLLCVVSFCLCCNLLSINSPSFALYPCLLMPVFCHVILVVLCVQSLVCPPVWCFHTGRMSHLSYAHLSDYI